MAEKGTLAKVQADRALYDTIIKHRKNWIKLKDVDYDKLQRASLSFVPSGELLNYFRDDYTKMLELLIYGDPPDFDAIIDRLREINALFNAMTA